MGIVVKYVRLRDVPCPEYKTAGAAAFDLCAAETLKIYDFAKVPTGLAFEIPNGYVGKIFLRSSMSGQLKLANGVGVIDSDYRGEVLIPLLTVARRTMTIHAGTRIAQMIIEKRPKVELFEASELSETNRGCGGFGSTGQD